LWKEENEERTGYCNVEMANTAKGDILAEGGRANLNGRRRGILVSEKVRRKV